MKVRSKITSEVTIVWEVTVTCDEAVELASDKNGRAKMVNAKLKKRVFDEAFAKLQKCKPSDGEVSSLSWSALG